MESLVLVESVLQEGDLVLKVGFFEHPLRVVAHHFIFHGIFGHEVLDLFGK